MAMLTTATAQQANVSMQLGAILDKGETLTLRIEHLIESISSGVLGTGTPERLNKNVAQPMPGGLLPGSVNRIGYMNERLSRCADELYHICNELGINTATEGIGR